MLTDIELYYSDKIISNTIIIEGEEIHHIKNVMRHKIGDIIYVTDGEGQIYKTSINLISNTHINAIIKEKYQYVNRLQNFTICIPIIKNNDRLEFAIEKCIELGITNFIIFESQRTYGKRIKYERINKLLISAMKQSLRSWLPNVNFLNNITEINNSEGYKIIFDQKSNKKFIDFIIENKGLIQKEKFYLIVGPEGGLTKEEIKKIENSILVNLSENRLRTETAIITATSVITTIIL